MKRKVNKKSIFLTLVAILTLFGGFCFAVDASNNTGSYTTKDGEWEKIENSDNVYGMDKDGDGIYDIQLTKNENEWEYVFTVEDDKAEYYAWEEDVPENYQTIANESGQQGTRINPKKEKSSTEIINRLNGLDYHEPEEEKHHYLILEKMVYCEKEDAVIDEEKQFCFNITLENDSYDLSGYKQFGEVLFEDGKATIYLNHGNGKVLDLPVGTSWTIEEKVEQNYKNTIDLYNEKYDGTTKREDAIESNVIKGIIEENDEEQSVVFNNIYTGEKDEYGYFALYKQVINGNNDDEFNFTIDFTGLKPNHEYQYPIVNYTTQQESAIYFVSPSSGICTLNLSLKNNDILMSDSLPAGATYKIREDASDYIASYKITPFDEEDYPQIDALSYQDTNYETNQELSTRREVVEPEELALVTFTNEKPKEEEKEVSEITVSKQWDDNDNENNIRPESINVYLYQSDEKGEIGDLIGTALLDSSQNWQTTFSDLDCSRTYYYSVLEDKVEGYTSRVVRQDDGNFVVVNTLDTEPKGDLFVDLKVEGELANRDQNFRVTIKLTDKDNKPITGTFLLDNEIGTKPGTIYFDDHGQAILNMKDGDSLCIVNLPVDSKYTIIQDKLTDWTTRYEESNQGLIASQQLAKVDIIDTYNIKKPEPVKPSSPNSYPIPKTGID